MFAQDRKSESATRAKKKVPKELLDALKNTQKIPPPPHGRVPGEGVFPQRPVFPDRRLTHDYARPEARPPEIKATPPISRKFYDDILEDDIEKIAYQGVIKKASKPSQQVVPEPQVTPVNNQKQPQDQQSQLKKQKEKPKSRPATNISERPTTQHTIIQSVYYPDDQYQGNESKGKSSELEEFKLNRSYIQLPKPSRQTEKQYSRRQDYERYCQTERKDKKAPKSYLPENRYQKPEDFRSPEYVDSHYYSRREEIPVTRQELYRYYAKKQKFNTLPDLKEEKRVKKNLTQRSYRKEYQEDLIYPSKTSERVVYNHPPKEPRGQLKNITNGYLDPIIYPSISGYSKIPSLTDYGGYQRDYERRLKEGYITDRPTYADVIPYFDPYASINRSTRDYFGTSRRSNINDFYARARFF